MDYKKYGITREDRKILNWVDLIMWGLFLFSIWVFYYGSNSGIAWLAVVGMSCAVVYFVVAVFLCPIGDSLDNGSHPFPPESE